MQPNWLAEQDLRGADWFSFDVFDTLVKRETGSHSSLLKVLAASEGLDAEPFIKARQEADRRARIKNEHYTIDDIYQELQGYSVVQASRLLSAEIELEIELARPNKILIDFYKQIAESQSVIVLISDMYLPEWVVDKIVRKVGVSNFEALFVSNRHGASKRNGKLFKLASQHVSKNLTGLVHLGDSPRRDFLMPRLVGAKSILVRRTPPKVITRPRRTLVSKFGLIQSRNEIERLRESQKILSAFLSNRTQFNSDIFDLFGYTALGPLLYAFTKWLSRCVLEEKHDTVVFAARDAHLIQRAFEVLNPSVSSQYAFISRKSLRPALFDAASKLDEIISELFFAHPRITAHNFLLELGLSDREIMTELERAAIKSEHLFLAESRKTDDSFTRLLSCADYQITKYNQEGLSRIQSYLKQLELGKSIAIVDSGWSGTIQYSFERALEVSGYTTTVTGYYLAIASAARERVAKKPLMMEGFLANFTRDGGGEILDIELGFIEAWLSAPHGTTYAYGKEGTPMVESLLAEENPLLDSVGRAQEAALRFVREFSESPISKIEIPPSVAYSRFEDVILFPNRSEVLAFGDVMNNRQRLAPRRPLQFYLRQPKMIRRDFEEARWKSGFLKSWLRIPLPYARGYILALRFGLGQQGKRRL